MATELTLYDFSLFSYLRHRNIQTHRLTEKIKFQTFYISTINKIKKNQVNSIQPSLMSKIYLYLIKIYALDTPGTALILINIILNVKLT